MTNVKRKLIEVSLPLEKINAESAREKSIRHGHPSTLHLWWARRPLAAARAVLFAQLVDDPSARPDEFPTEEAQRIERERLHGIIERLVAWENTRDQTLLDEARQEILKSTDGNPPPIVDPFAGGGTIPLEAQRLGLEAHASDLNPVAVLINKALIEIPPKFAARPPVFPGLAESKMDWPGATGLAADVRAYGQWMRDEAQKRIGRHYPKAKLPDGGEATVIAWIWARTVACPNPACGIEMPLVRSWWLGKKKGKEAWIRPLIVADDDHPSGKRVEFDIAHTASGPEIDGTMSGRQGGVCVDCGTAVAKDHIKAEAVAGRMSAALMAVVAEGHRQRVYVAPTAEQETAAKVAKPSDVPDQDLGYDPRNLWTPQYGLTRFSDLFTNRQLLALTTFSDLIAEARERVLADSEEVGYASAVATYLAFALSRMLNKSSSVSGWDSSTKVEGVRGVFARQALAMAWDYGEANPFGGVAGDIGEDINWVGKVIDFLPADGVSVVSQGNASARRVDGLIVSTDPPYYDNIADGDRSRARQRVLAVFVYAIELGIGQNDPAAIVKGAMAPLVKGRQPAVTDLAEARQVLAAIEAIPAHPTTRLANRLLALTVVRPGELWGARWVRFEGLDGAEALWRVPPDRMKMKREQLVPLSRQAVDVLR